LQAHHPLPNTTALLMPLLTPSPPFPHPSPHPVATPQALHAMGFRVVQDVVYNHTFAAGPYSHNSVLDKIVPGYYHRRQEDGEICHSTCCNSECGRGGAVCVEGRGEEAALHWGAHT
jgi:hypothetical protein